MEETFRGRVDPDATSAALADARQEPWFDLTYLPSQMPPPDESWDDMDFDPAVHIARIGCPTLLIYGADEECVPARESEAVWREFGERDLTVAYLPGCGHFPVVGGSGRPEPDDLTGISPHYTAALIDWCGSSTAFPR
jgi:pimeloyl-ACP methyl ester carboxylesterase